MWPILFLAARSLSAKRQRAALLITTLAGVAFIWVAVHGVTGGMRKVMLEQLLAIRSGHVNVIGLWKRSSQGRAIPVLSGDARVEEAIRSVYPAASISRRLVGVASISSARTSLAGETLVVGVPLDRTEAAAKLLQLSPEARERFQGEAAVILFKPQAEELGVRAGDIVTIYGRTHRNAWNTVAATVAAVVPDLGEATRTLVLAPNQTVASLFQFPPNVPTSLDVLIPGQPTNTQIMEAALRIREQVERRLGVTLDYDEEHFSERTRHASEDSWAGQRMLIGTWEQESSGAAFAIGLVSAFATAIAFFLMVVISIGVMNLFWLAVRERTAEIGTLRAIGMQGGQVARAFLLEGALLGALGGFVGAASALLTLTVLNRLAAPMPEALANFLAQPSLSFVVGIPHLALVVLVCAVTCAGGAFLPALASARMRPLQSLNHI